MSLVTVLIVVMERITGSAEHIERSLTSISEVNDLVVVALLLKGTPFALVECQNRIGPVATKSDSVFKLYPK